jgi:PAS domain-containing protein
MANGPESGHWAFLAGGGEMGALMRAKDWSGTSLGRPGTWSQGLRAAVRLMLNTRHPMYIFWGADSACLYNDAFKQSIAPERHPGSLGRPASEAWQEIWSIVGPQIEHVMDGHGDTWHENQLIPITRFGVREEVYWTYSYGPIDDDTAPSGVGGVLVICSEKTEAVMNTRRLAESEERLQLALAGGRGVGTWDWDVVNDRVVADRQFARLYGVDPERAAVGAPIAEFFIAQRPSKPPQSYLEAQRRHRDVYRRFPGLRTGTAGYSPSAPRRLLRRGKIA